MPIHTLSANIENVCSFSADDRILLGEGVFETIRIKKQAPCYSRLHWQRMQNAAKLLEIEFDLSFDQWCKELTKSIKRSKVQTGGIKVILSGGRAPRGLTSHGENSCIAFQAFNYQPYQQELSLVSAKWLRDAANPIYQLKSVNYLEAILARRQALACGADDALFFNLNNKATETTVANIFIVKQDHIYTPKSTDGVLAGIIRDRIFSLCSVAGIACFESSLEKESIYKADAIFTTNSLQGIQVVKTIDTHKVGNRHDLITLLRQALANDEVLFS